MKSYKRATANDSDDARIFYEYDQLRKKLNHSSKDRLEDLKRIRDKIISRDDFTVEYAALLNFNYKYREAIELIENRRFHCHVC